MSINNIMSWNNRNLCFSFTETLSTSLKQLSATICSEVIIANYGTGFLKVYDQNLPSDGNAFFVAPSGSFTFRGLTNSSEVSAAFASGSGLVSYRTQYFSNFNLGSV